MGFTITDSVPVITVLLQGLLSFFSPCVLPLLPLYIGYLSGGTGVVGADGEYHYARKKVMLNTVCFVIGIGFSFFLLGLGMRAIGRFFSGNQLLFARIGGVIVILFGLYQLGVFGFSFFLGKERRLPLRLDKMAMSPLTALLMGFVFSFAWTPCVGPALSGVLLMAASANSSAAGFALIGVYTLGFTVPFLLTGFFTTAVLGLFKRHRSIVKYTVKISGALLVLMGVLMILGKMNDVSGYLSRISASEKNEIVEEQADTSVKEDNPKATEADADGSSSSKTAEEEASSDESNDSSDVPNKENNEAAAESDTDGASADDTVEDASDNAPDDTDTTASTREVIPAPDFTLKDQYGFLHTLSDYQGKIVFLNFWATWCPPCRAEMPDIQALYEETLEDEDSELVILGVAFPNYGQETSEQEIKLFLEDNGYTYPVLFDTAASLMSSYYLTAYPTTYMIDRDGNIYGYVPGSLTKEVMEDIIRQTAES